jgi:hypothetical protein
MIKCVTFTGANNTTNPMDLLQFANEFPQVEWGILLSESRMGEGRYPDWDWLYALAEIKNENPKLKLSGHICGKWVRHVCHGNWTILDDFSSHGIFNRFQLNFSPYIKNIKDKFFKALKEDRVRLDGEGNERQFIFQLNSLKNKLLNTAWEQDIPAYPLFDCSGGKGIMPNAWPERPNYYCGYAGGLNVNNIKEQLLSIQDSAGEQNRDNAFWIDSETGVLTNEVLDFDKCRKIMEACNGYF